jgi:hypothetical protein
MKIRPVEAEFFHADRQTDMTKLILAFHNSANAPNKHYQSDYEFNMSYCDSFKHTFLSLS